MASPVERIKTLSAIQLSIEVFHTFRVRNLSTSIMSSLRQSLLVIIHKLLQKLTLINRYKHSSLFFHVFALHILNDKDDNSTEQTLWRESTLGMCCLSHRSVTLWSFGKVHSVCRAGKKWPIKSL
jgi:hypothetical protein